MIKGADKLPKKIKETSDKKSIYIFLFCLIISSGFWAITKLSKFYIHEICYDVKYSHIPIDKSFYKNTKDKVYVKVKANGFSLLKNKIFTRKLIIKLTEVIRKGDRGYFWKPKDHFREIANEIGNLEILEIKSKNPFIFLPLSNKASKRVPVYIDAHILYKKAYKKKKILLAPNYVKITGSEKALRRIHFIKTKKWYLEKVYLDTQNTLDLIVPENIKISHNQINVKLLVEPCTEKTMVVPIKVVNPHFLNVKLSTYKVKLTFKIGYDNYNKNNLLNFVVECNLSNNPKDKIYQLPLSIKSVPDFIDIKDVLIYPDKVRVFVLD